MKKTLIAAIAAIALSLPAWGQVINVNTPGTDWCIGGSYTITWTKSGAMPDTVKIRLRRAGAPETEASVWAITDSTANDGSFGTAAVPASVPAGNYFIRVRTIGDPDVIGNSGVFHIATCTQTITVTTPSADWCIGTGYTINWTKSGIMPDTVKIRLRRAGAPETEASVWNITDSTANDGSFGTAAVPASVPAGNYFIRVRTIGDPDVIGNSANFEVKDCAAGPSITVTKPDTTHGWCTGRPGLIQWTTSGVMSAFVKIILYSAPYSPGEIGSMLTAHTSNDGEYTWPVPDTQAPGDYLVKVQTTTGNISDFSGMFKIHMCIDPIIFDKLRKIRYYIRIPKWPPEPDPWWKIDFGEFREVMKNKFEGSVFLLKNGQKVKEIGNFGKTSPLPDSLKFQMGELNSKSLKNQSAKFSLGFFNAQGVLLQETPLEVQVEQQLR